MLADTKLRSLRPKGKLYKVPDRNGLYVAVTGAGERCRSGSTLHQIADSTEGHAACA